MTDTSTPSERRLDNQKLYDEAAKRPFNPDGGEDEASVTEDGNDGNLKDDQKPLNATLQSNGLQKEKSGSSPAVQEAASQVNKDDP